MTSLPPSSAPSPTPGDGGTTTCPSCQAEATGKFCSNCGSPLAGATCGACDAPLTPGGKFCHRCGAPARAGVTGEAKGSSPSLPWGVAAIALVALIALAAGQWFGRPNQGEQIGEQTGAPPTEAAAAPFAGATGNGQAPDISKFTPAEAAVRLYNRIMSAHQAGHADTVQMFAPMAITAYEMIGTLDTDQRYDVGRIAAISGNEAVARAQADTILSKNPNHLLGLILAGNAAHLRKDAAAEASYHAKLVAAVPTEKPKQLPEYITHDADINIALDAKRP
ncbi:MAG: zinc ribbon domain-containing protein [Gemmatimonadaceae bacterium]